MKRGIKSKVYAALGFHESRLEIAILTQLECGERHLALRSVALPRGVICAESGRLMRPADLRDLIQETMGTMVPSCLVEVMIGIPDNLCRTRTVQMTANPIHERQSSVSSQVSSDSGHVFDISPKKSNAKANGEAFMVSCSTEDVMRYVSAAARKGWIVTNLTPLVVARFNYLAERSPGAAGKRLLLVHACESACDIALWSDELLLYREHLIQGDTSVMWESACDKRTQQIAARIEGSYAVVIRAPRELTRLINARSPVWRALAIDVDDECSLARTIEGEFESRTAGYFDAVLGLLTQSTRRQGSLRG